MKFSGLNEMSTISLLHLNNWFPDGSYLGRIRRYGLDGGSIILGSGFGVSKDTSCLLNEKELSASAFSTFCWLGLDSKNIIPLFCYQEPFINL